MVGWGPVKGQRRRGGAGQGRARAPQRRSWCWARWGSGADAGGHWPGTGADPGCHWPQLFPLLAGSLSSQILTLATWALAGYPLADWHPPPSPISPSIAAARLQGPSPTDLQASGRMAPPRVVLEGTLTKVRGMVAFPSQNLWGETAGSRPRLRHLARPSSTGTPTSSPSCHQARRGSIRSELTAAAAAAAAGCGIVQPKLGASIHLHELARQRLGCLPFKSLHHAGTKDALVMLQDRGSRQRCCVLSVTYLTMQPTYRTFNEEPSSQRLVVRSKTIEPVLNQPRDLPSRGYFAYPGRILSEARMRVCGMELGFRHARVHASSVLVSSA
ncbi:hypothetical protein F4780DRAFT_235483 [Xylariomycetidae sp. FL0641]|nr:hypothetical protein F4780DRAFT_235483 [Xylariomycetidae sp. FL0641]